MIATSARAAPSSGGRAASPGASASSSQSERWGMGGETRGSSGPSKRSGNVALRAPQHLGGSVRRPLLGRLVEVDLDAFPLVEVHRLGLVGERDPAHGACMLMGGSAGTASAGAVGPTGAAGPLPAVGLSHREAR